MSAAFLLGGRTDPLLCVAVATDPRTVAGAGPAAAVPFGVLERGVLERERAPLPLSR